MIIPKQLKKQKFIKTKEKSPIELEWTTKRNYSSTNPQFMEYLKNATTYGVLCGINNLIVIDLDNEAIQKEILEKHSPFNKTFTVKTAGKGLLHFYFYTDVAPQSFKCLDKDYNTLMDIQGIGRQVIGPSSKLANNRTYDVVNDVPILNVTYHYIKNVLSYYDEVKRTKTEKKEYNGEKDDLIEEIKSKVTVSKILSKENINIRKNPTDCPFHNSEGGKCLSFTDDVWHCFHCERSGDIFTLYMELNKCDFATAKEELLNLAGIKKKLVLQETKNKKLKEYKELDVKKYIIFKSKDETIYQIYIGNFYITLTPDTILGSGEFRKKYFNETGYLLKSISPDDWVGLINEWVEEYGHIIDQTSEVNTETMIVETMINDIQNFAPVIEPVEAISYGRVLFLKEETNYVYVCNKVLDSILKKNQFKITMSKLKVLLDDYIVGNSKVIRTGKILSRFFRFKLELLPNIEIEDLLKDENN